MARRSSRKASGLGPPQRSAPMPAPRAARRPRRAALLVAAAVVVAVGVGGGLLLTAKGGSKPIAASINWSSLPELQTTAPPWPSESSLLPGRVAAAGLHRLTMEGTALHIHAHLDVYVNGHKVPVPALVGIDNRAGFLTELHTHDTSGVIHVESPVVKSFALGQFFCEWGVKLTANCLGRYHGPVAWWVNGVRGHGNPAQLALEAHQEIVIAAGRPPARVPTSYSFAAGL